MAIISSKRYDADLLVYGPCSNAGDVLIHQTFNGLFRENLNTLYHHIRNDKLKCDTPNIIIGPGGILSGSYRPDIKPDEWLIKYLDESKVAEWERNNKHVYFFGTGSNTPFNPNTGSKPFSMVSEKIIRNLIALSRLVYLRGTADIQRIQSFCESKDTHKFHFQPCPSVFLDKIFNIIPKKEDKIAINLPLGKIINAENKRSHPIKRFVDYANSLGLKVCFLGNHTLDLNKDLLDVFDEVPHTEKFIRFLKSEQFEDYSKAQNAVHSEWEDCNCLPSRFNGYRFAFGSRLHSFLPFMAFNTPSLLLANLPIRMPMPIEYFKNPVFGAKINFNHKNLDSMVDAMIERLDYFIKKEDYLVDIIMEQKYRLWEITQKNKDRMLSDMQW